MSPQYNNGAEVETLTIAQVFTEVGKYFVARDGEGDVDAGWENLQRALNEDSAPLAEEPIRATAAIRHSPNILTDFSIRTHVKALALGGVAVAVASLLVAGFAWFVITATAEVCGLVTLRLAQRRLRPVAIYHHESNCAGADSGVEFTLAADFVPLHKDTVTMRILELEGADLRGEDLFSLNLISARLHAVNLDGVTLRGANLLATDLSSAHLFAAELSYANLTNANLRRADLTRALLIGSRMSGAHLAGATLSGANLTGANLCGADLTGADLTGAILAGANLSWAKLTGANLTGAILTSAALYHADLTDTYLGQANLRNAFLATANLLRADLAWADLTGADFTRTVLTAANLTGAEAPTLPAASQVTWSARTQWDRYQHIVAQRSILFGPDLYQLNPLYGSHGEMPSQVTLPIAG
ncbi:pentapeptide repeat-containing protein [Nocardia sp. NPDC005366]|uniref:pentapeptide repeat-containing protein n=1 Tax=Nocardia sp. NPDC005366 TaxID=3156878 RepID=UPI0033ACD687